MAKPTQTTEWCSDASYVEPSAGKKLVGFEPAERPCAEYLDWLFFTIEEWLVYLDSGALEGNFSITGDLAVGDDLAVTGDATVGGAVVHSGIISPATIGSAQANYAPTGIATATVLRLVANGAGANQTIRGLAASQVAGRLIEIHNVGTSGAGDDGVLLAHEDAAATAANRFFFPGATDVTIPLDGCAVLRYDGTNSRWRLVAKNF